MSNCRSLGPKLIPDGVGSNAALGGCGRCSLAKILDDDPKSESVMVFGKCLSNEDPNNRHTQICHLNYGCDSV